MVERERVNMRVTLVWWSILLAGSMGVMLYFGSRKAIVISDVAYGQNSIGGTVADESDGDAGWRKSLALQSSQDGKGCFRIPLEKSVKAEDVTIENRYLDRELHIFLEGVGESFYENQTVQGDISCIASAYWERQGDGVLIRMQMDGVYEYKTSMENGMLKMEACVPKDIYRMIVVVDPAGEAALSTGRAVQRQWENSNVRLYFTQSEDEGISKEQKADLVKSVGADLFVRLSVAEDADGQRYGICGWYNDLYVIPEFGNVQLSDILVRNVTISAQNSAKGLFPAEEESILQQMRVPAAEITLGYMTNERECALLVQESYHEKLAEGIVKALEEVYGTYYE